MEERPGAPHRSRERFHLQAGLQPFEIFAQKRQGDAVTDRHHETRRPDLDIQLVDDARRERLGLVVAVIRAPLGGVSGVDRPVRGAKPALADRVWGSRAP